MNVKFIMLLTGCRPQKKSVKEVPRAAIVYDDSNKSGCLFCIFIKCSYLLHQECNNQTFFPEDMDGC